MKTNKSNYSIKSVACLVAALSFVATFHPATCGAAGKPPPHVELKITGAIFTLPDHTGDLDSDQCREAGLDATGLGHRKTTMDLTALGLGIQRHAVRLDFVGKTAGPGTPATFSFWLTKNCQLLVSGFISAGAWPLPAGSPGSDLVVTIPAGMPWTLNRYGGGAAACSGNSTLAADVTITIRRNDARTGNVCDCPFDYTDANANRIADECE